MEDKEKRLIAELTKCRSSIARSKHLIEKHRDILKKQEKRAAEIEAKLDREKMHSLYDLIHKGGYDIDRIRDAVSSGNISEQPADTSNIPETTDMAAEKAAKKSTHTAADDEAAERNE